MKMVKTRTYWSKSLLKNWQDFLDTQYFPEPGPQPQKNTSLRTTCYKANPELKSCRIVSKLMSNMH